MNIQEKIVESCKRVYNQLGYGLMELNYEKALVIDLKSIGIKCDNEIYVNLDYQDINGEKHFLTSLRIDILIKPDIVIELKTVKSILKKDDKEYYQVKRYEKLLNARESYLVNFGIKGLEIYQCTGDSYISLIDN